MGMWSKLENVVVKRIPHLVEFSGKVRNRSDLSRLCLVILEVLMQIK